MVLKLQEKLGHEDNRRSFSRGRGGHGHGHRGCNSTPKFEKIE